MGNVEETFVPRDAAEDETIVPKVDHVTPRFLLQAQAEALLLSREVEPEFARYVGSVMGMATPPRVLAPRARTSPYSLVGSALNDRDLMAELQAISRRRGARLESYYETGRVLELADALDVPAGPTGPEAVRSGVLDRFNHKQSFKELAFWAGLATVPGRYAETVDEVVAVIREIDRSGWPRRELEEGLAPRERLPERFFACERPARFMLRKVLAGGGLGNLCGTAADLERALPAFCRGGGVLVEPQLSVRRTLGSLARIGERRIEWLGVDEQIIREGSWAGLDYPVEDESLVRPIRDGTLRLARRARDLGARGYLNVDWAVVDVAGRHVLVALEANARHNGFSHVVELVRCLRGRFAPAAHVTFVESVPLPARVAVLGDLEEELCGVKCGGSPALVDRPGRERGALVVLPPRSGSCGLLFHGPTRDSVRDLVRKVYGRLA